MRRLWKPSRCLNEIFLPSSYANCASKYWTFSTFRHPLNFLVSLDLTFRICKIFSFKWLLQSAPDHKFHHKHVRVFDQFVKKQKHLEAGRDENKKVEKRRKNRDVEPEEAAKDDIKFRQNGRRPNTWLSYDI